jgi:serine/threonine protein kinase
VRELALPSDAVIADRQLAEQCVASGLLNRWQAEQLLQGRTKFTLGPYRILDAIGYGGMGYVFKGEHSLLGRIEAIKVLPSSKSDPASIASFCREIRAQAQLDHPNLVRLSFADKEGDTYFLVTEYVAGSDLRRLVRRHGPLSARQAAVVVSQAAAALDYAHGRGLVHRDVKPGNLLVAAEGRTKLTDLGLAAFSVESPDAEDAADARLAQVVGTPDFIAPEAISAPSKVRRVSDIYSLGCTLYYAVTGKVPFPGGKTRDKLRRHLEEPPLTPLRLAPGLDPDLVDLIAEMMHKDPERRLATAGEAVERLRRWTDRADESTWHELGKIALEPGEAALQRSELADTAPALTHRELPMTPTGPPPRVASPRFPWSTSAASEPVPPPLMDPRLVAEDREGLGFVALVLIFAALATAAAAVAAALTAS